MSKILIAIAVMFFGSVLTSVYLMHKIYEELDDDDWI